jgi:uncharacterized membrane protein YdbT with pleckstrin-like domain
MQKLDPKAVWLFFISFVFRAIVPAIILTIWISAGVGNLFRNTSTDNISVTIIGMVPVVIVAYLILLFVWAKLTYRFYKYELTDIGFKKESGVIYKKYVTIPYDRIQNVDIYRGIWARILGLSDLHIQTAGMSAVMGKYGAVGVSAEGRLPGLSKEVAEQLRDELIKRTRKNISQGV